MPWHLERLLVFERVSCSPLAICLYCSWPFHGIQENNKALKYVQYIPALSVRLEGDTVSEIVTRCDENFIFNTPSLEKECFRQGFTDCWILSCFLCAQEISFQLSWNTAIS